MSFLSALGSYLSISIEIERLYLEKRRENSIKNTVRVFVCSLTHQLVSSRKLEVLSDFLLHVVPEELRNLQKKAKTKKPP